LEEGKYLQADNNRVLEQNRVKREGKEVKGIPFGLPPRIHLSLSEVLRLIAAWTRLLHLSKIGRKIRSIANLDP
jgi:hypothetical protein